MRLWASPLASHAAQWRPSHSGWTEFLRSLSVRGLGGVHLVISDAHQGPKNATARVLAVSRQRCRVHFVRSALGHVPKKQHAMETKVIGTSFVQETAEEAVATWRETADRPRDRFPWVDRWCSSLNRQIAYWRSRR